MPARALPGDAMIRDASDAHSRAFERWVLAFVLSFDLVASTIFVFSVRASPVVHPLSPRLLLAVGENAAAIWALFAIGLAGIAGFALRPARVLPALLALFSVGLLVETDAALRGGPQRFLFFGGATLVGWICGTIWARALGVRSVENVEAYAERGALAALAACYLGAVSSKLLQGGAWGDGSTLRATVLAQHSVGRSAWLDAYAAAVGNSALLAGILAWTTLLAQTSAILLPFGRRPRAFAAFMLLAFHVNVWLLTPIAFLQSMALLVGFGFPWSSWLRLAEAKSERAAPEEPSPKLLAPVAIALAAIAGFVLLLRYGPTAAFSHAEHHDPSPGHSASHASAPPDATARASSAARAPEPPALPIPNFARAAAAALEEGTVVSGFRVARLSGTEEGAFVVALSDGQRSFRVRAESAERPSAPPPLRAHGYAFYFDTSRGETSPAPGEMESALAAVARAFSAGTGTNSSQP